LKKLLLLFSFVFVNSFLLKAQSTQIFTEDFQTGGASFTLNSGGPAASVGNNKWIVNNNYTGLPTYPNTMREDSTYSGTIAFAPYSQYLHIHDAASGVNNCNYNPTNASDNFAYMSSGICTLGMDSVHFSFFYLCEGSATAYGQVYYSVSGGPWTAVGLGAYNSKSKWQYEDITNPAFSNVGNLRFGFRWINNSGIALNSEAFGIDDIDIVGYYNSVTGVSINIDSVTPNPICRGNTLFIYYHLSDTLCDGTYQIQLSNPTGTSFPGTIGWVYNIYYPTTSGVIAVTLPTTVVAGACYRIRINRTSPPPVIMGIASACFSIINCPNIITTLQPIVTTDTNAVCTGSAIDVPFYSTGVYSFNTYTAQLSDSTGSFASPSTIGTFLNSGTYDPALGSPPGSVSGIIPNVPPGCGYYIRVISSSPVATGSVWGPFCIRDCDINTNHHTDLHFCVVDCASSSVGLDTLITIGDSTATYFPGNIFTTQMMSMMTFAQIGPNGLLGAVAATTDTTLNIHIPCKDSLAIVGIPIGTNYMRIVATNTSEPDNALGSLIRITIGAPHTNGEIITSYNYSSFMPQDTFCVGESAFFLFAPYNYADNSTYMWQSPEINGGNPFASPSGANSNSLFLAPFTSPGMITIHVQETSYGCVGPWSPTDTIIVLGPPVVTITGPTVVCQGDTVHYSVPFASNTYYSWTTTGGAVVDTANNEIFMVFGTTGSYTLTMHAINECGSSTASKTIIVKPYPTITPENDTTICVNDPITLTTNTGAGYTFSWSNGVSIVSSTNTASVTPLVNTTYIVTVTSPGGCKRRDTISVQVQTPGTATFADSVCPQGVSPINLSVDTAGISYLWSTGATTQQILVNDTGTYTVSEIYPGKTCPKIITFHVGEDPCPVAVILTLPNVFSPNGDGSNDFFTPITSGDFDKFDVKIYNRWGQLLFESSDPFFKWNGTDKTGKAVDGVYYYIVTTSLNAVDDKKDGFITLTR
jgi:gliding motility-associated-like protein